MFKNVSSVKRREQLEAMADGVEEMTYMQELSTSEIEFHRDRFAQKSIEISKINDDLKKYKDQVKEKLAPVRVEMTESLQCIKLKAVQVTGKVYKIVKQDEQMTGYYDENGQLIKTRPMTSDEKQLTIASSARTGTND